MYSSIHPSVHLLHVLSLSPFLPGPPSSIRMSVLSKPITEDNLLVIFARLSLSSLLRLPLVCSTWHKLKLTACNSIHHLTLSIRDPTQPSDKVDCPLEYSTFTVATPMVCLSKRTLIFNYYLTEANARLILDTFPKIRRLNLENKAINFDDFPLDLSIPSLLVLLHKDDSNSASNSPWASTLTHVAVYGFPTGAFPPQTGVLQSECLCHLLAAINSLTIKNLTVDVNNKFIHESSAMTLQLPILSRPFFLHSTRMTQPTFCVNPFQLLKGHSFLKFVLDSIHLECWIFSPFSERLTVCQSSFGISLSCILSSQVPLIWIQSAPIFHSCRFSS